MKKTLTIACFLIGLVTLFPPILVSKSARGFLFNLHLGTVHVSGLVIGSINWSALFAEHIVIITLSISMYYGWKLFFQNKEKIDNEKGLAKNGTSTAPPARKQSGNAPEDHLVGEMSRNKIENGT